MIPEVNFTRCHHFCSIVSDISSNLRDTTLTCSNCGVVNVKFDPCECCQLLPQCRKCRRRLPTRCFAKSTTANICEVRHVLSVSIDWSFLTLHLNKQTRFSCANKLVYWYICRAELRCEEAAISKAEVKSSAGGFVRRTWIRNAFGWHRLQDLPPSQRRDNSQSSRGLAPSKRVHMILLYNNNNNNYDSFDCYIESVSYTHLTLPTIYSV